VVVKEIRDVKLSEIEIIDLEEIKPRAFNCQLCSSRLNEHPKGLAILFICPNCKFKILTIKELFLRCFRKRSDSTIITPQCPDCGEEMRYCYSEYSVALWVCAGDGTRKYVVNKNVMEGSER
jgi:RNase P subunit RPR2